MRSVGTIGHAGRAPRLLVGGWLGAAALVVPTSLWSHTVVPAASNLVEGVTRVASARSVGDSLETAPNHLSKGLMAVRALELPSPVEPAERAGARVLSRANPGLPPAALPGQDDEEARRQVSLPRDDGAAEPSEPEQVPEEPRDPEQIASIGRETWVYANADAKSEKLGYLRFGTRIQRRATAQRGQGCAGGWFGVSPDGYVCNNGRSATTDLGHPLLSILNESAHRAQPLPYAYVRPRGAPVPLHARLADTGDSVGRSGTLVRSRSGFEGLRTLQSARPWAIGALKAFGFPRAETVTPSRVAKARAGFSLLGLYEQDKKLYGLTPDLDFIELDLVRPAEPSAFRGIALEDGTTLPVAFSMDRGAFLYEGDPVRGTLRPVRKVDYREAIPVTGVEVQAAGMRLLRTQSGQYLAGTQLRVISPRPSLPDFAESGRVWVDVSVSEQSLVAYDGTRPAYVTLVSTGREGLADAEGSTPTKRGTFPIWAKHVTATMSGDDDQEPYEMRDVPWVQYFSGGYALHAAYWHDGFGAPRSHGCVNLSPVDARWLFHFTTPGVPMKWHGVMVRPTEASLVEVRE